MTHFLQFARTRPRARGALALSVAAAMLASFAMLAAPAGATTPSAETIVLLRDSSGSEIGWSASGAFADSGSWTTDFLVFGALPSPPDFQNVVKTTQTSSTGSFGMNFQGQFNVLVSPTLSGTWSISLGTGAYATLRGTGTWSRSVDPLTGNPLFTCLGEVHFD
jgi:hypothetical protein